VPVGAKARRKSARAGRLAEFVCSLHLRLRAYGILARNFRAPTGEIDIIVRRGDTIVFVEVKLRRTLADALESLRPLQRGRIATTAELFLAAWSALAGLNARFDVMVVAPWRLPVHIANAWHI
jgi:putative endonuclease